MCVQKCLKKHTDKLAELANSSNRTACIERSPIYFKWSETDENDLKPVDFIYGLSLYILGRK